MKGIILPGGEDAVRAVLDNRKTQFRLPVKGVPEGTYFIWEEEGRWSCRGDGGLDYMEHPQLGNVKPRYKPGEVAYVKEAWAHVPNRADSEACLYREEYGPGWEGEVYWRPPLSMPEWASRLKLRITEVRFERLQEITYRGVQAEGLEVGDNDLSLAHYIQSFARCWDRMYPKHPWENNPWVEVDTFELIQL